MSRLSIKPAVVPGPGGARIARRWPTGDGAVRLTPHALRNLGCVIVRRVTDDLGRAWRVRQLALASGPALLFQCEVPGLRSEVRPARTPLESLSDEELLGALEPAGG
jgi:hypothetical protein